jgi:hypothetical protein
MDASEPARVLQEAWAKMSWHLERDAFAMIGFPEPPAAEDLAALSRPPAQLVREEFETTLLVRASEAEAILARHPAARVERDFVWVRFETPMSWDVVGFLARVTGALAEAGIPLGAVCGFSRDHLFLSRKHLEPARAVLDRLFPRPRRDA